MANAISNEAKKAMAVMSTASITLRDAISRSLPVANNQLLTVQIPGTVITWEDYYWDRNLNAFAPTSVRINEARLVDGMLPLSKISMGKTGKSVARSYLGALDLLMPVEASVSGLITGSGSTGSIDGRRQVIKERYETAMKYLTSLIDQPPGSTSPPESKLTCYVRKQDVWAKQVELYSTEQERVRKSISAQFPREDDTRARKEAYLQWIQEHSRDFKAAIQAKYMDWVVHGYKFNVEFHFGIVDISSGMKRVESSKEALRNLVVIAEDGFTEYSTVILEPSDWATIVRDKVIEWDGTHSQPTAAEIRAEIKRLTNLKQSCQALRTNADSGQYTGVIPNEELANEESNLQKAYDAVYKANNNKRSRIEGGGAPDLSFNALSDAYNKYKGASLKANREAVVQMGTDQKRLLTQTLDDRVAALQTDIDDLKKQLDGKTPSPLPIIDQNGNAVDPSELKKDEAFSRFPTGTAKPTLPPPSKWTRISAKVSSSSSTSTTVKEESASAFAVKAGWGFWSASAGASHTSASTKGMSSMSNLEVEITMECLVVNIDRPWLQAELFVDADLDVGPGFELSPGETELMRLVENNVPPPSNMQQFSSYPTAFVVAANVELSFSGDTAELESSLEASTTEANVKVGWGPFSLSASHKQSKTTSKSRTETTATGMKISLQAPQIIGWVQTLMPQLPKDSTPGKSRMEGLAIQTITPPATAPRPPQSNPVPAAQQNQRAAG